MEHLGKELPRVVDAAEASLRQVNEEESARPVLRGGWPKKQLPIFTGAKLGYSTFLGGSTCSKNPVGYAAAVNSTENAFVTGNIFPTVDPLFPSFSGSGNAVL